MNTNRRNFLKTIGLTSIPFLSSTATIASNAISEDQPSVDPKSEKPFINFVSDSVRFSPVDYIQKLAEINKIHPIESDSYGNGGTTKQLEEAYAKLTGKEKAIFLPTGTMANQLAIKLLSGENTKVLVPENSHIYRDEGDSAQSVHNKRLIPVGKDKPFFNLADLQQTISYHDGAEVFKSGWGAVVVENPVRRADGSFVPLDTIKEISKSCKDKGYKLHLDGARIHIASAFSGVSITEYSSYFDTVYISLYKYLNAPHGAILCGDASLIDKIQHQIKILGGTIYQTWTGTSIALHFLNGLDERWKNTAKEMELLVTELNKVEGVKISKIEFGTNIYSMMLDKAIDPKKMAQSLQSDNIVIGRPNTEGILKLMANESLLRLKTNSIAEAFKKSFAAARL